MKFFKNKFLVKLIASLCLVLMLLNFGVTNKVHASWGGTLLTPIIQLLRAIGDGIVNIVQQAVVSGNTTSLIKIEGEADIGAWLLTVFVTIVAVIAVVAVIALGGWGIGLAAAAAGHALGATFIIHVAEIGALAGIATGIIVGTKAAEEWFPEDLYLPTYKVTAQEIFANEIPLFDVNFFNPSFTKTHNKYETYVLAADGEEMTRSKGWYIQTGAYTENDKGLYRTYGDLDNLITHSWGGGEQYNRLTGRSWEDVVNFANKNSELVGNGFTALKNVLTNLNDALGMVVFDLDDEASMNKWGCSLNKFEEDGKYAHDMMFFYRSNDGLVDAKDKGNGADRDIKDTSNKSLGENRIVWIRIVSQRSADDEDVWEYAVQAGLVSDVSFKASKETEIVSVDARELSTSFQLSGVVSKWYFILRNLALLVLMLVLIYSGIRIVIASTAGEKAKYKERLIDWLVAMCLVMIMHYIMVFAVELVEKITDLVAETVGQPSEVNIPVREEWRDSMEEYDENGYELMNFVTTIDGIEQIAWPTDLMGNMRIKAQYENEGTAKWVGYSLGFLILVFYTLFFAWTYLKRVVYMAFLTMISPLVAMTYPIDKITDGKAQAFNTWLKEYIFNLMIQPLHLLLYNILIGSAIQLANENALYTIVAIGFLIPAEKLLRKFFGFEKAKTPGLLSGAAGAALTMSGIQSLSKFGSRGGNSKQVEQADSDKIKFSSSGGVSPMDEVIDLSENAGTSGGNNSTIRISHSGNNVTEQRDINVNKDVNEQEVALNSVRTSTTNNKEAERALEEEKRAQEEVQAKSQKDAEEHGKRVKELAHQQNKEAQRNHRILRTIGAIGGSYRRGLQNKALTRMKNGRPIRAMARGVAGLAGGATLGMLGLTLGIASGDPSKAFQYATGAAVGGYGLGKGLAGSAVDALSVNGKVMTDEVELEWYGDEYKKVKLEQEKQKLLKNEEYISYIRKTTGKSRGEAIEILEKTGISCLDSGITNIEDIVAVHKMSEELAEERIISLTKTEDNKIIQEVTEKEKAEIELEARKHAIAMKKLSDRLPTDINKMSESKIRGHRRQFEKELQERIEKKLIAKGMAEDKAKALATTQAEQSSHEIIKGIIRFSDTKSDLTKV